MMVMVIQFSPLLFLSYSGMLDVPAEKTKTNEKVFETTIAFDPFEVNKQDRSNWILYGHPELLLNRFSNNDVRKFCKISTYYSKAMKDYHYDWH